MNRQLSIALLSFCLYSLFWYLPDTDKFNMSYHSLNRGLFISVQHGRLDSIKTEKEYLAALRAAEEKIFQNEFEKEFLLLLDAQQTQEYNSLSTLEARKTFIENYWKAANPNPLLPENDWLLDILKRRVFARENFPAPAPPYFDDRGKYYLKYGKPRFRFEDPGDLNIYPNETWSYENVTRDFLVHFVKEGTVYHEIEDLTMILIAGRRIVPEKRAAQWGALAIKRAAVSPVLGRAAGKIHELATAKLHANQFPNSLTALTIEYAIPHTIQMQIVEQAKRDVYKAHEAAPPAAHDEIQAVNKLKFTHDLAQFRGPKGTTRLELSLLAPLEKNLLKKFSRDSADTLRLGYGGLLRDPLFATVAEDRMQHEFSVKLAAEEKLTNAAGRLTMTALPQKCELTLQIKDLRQDKIGFARQEIDIRDFTGTALMISDIQLLTEVTMQNQKQLLPVSTKQNMQVSPYPFEEIRKSNPLLCYFEIYNLKTSGVVEQYEIVYKAVSEKSGNQDVAVSVSSTRAVSDDTAQELIGIDLRKVPKGKQRLEITVTALNNRNVTASMQKEIRIDD
jgi:GWxTD domain-containing protein